MIRQPSSGNVSVVGSLSAASCSCPSDARLKTGVSPIKGALEKVEKLQGVNYLWKPGARPGVKLPEGNQIGLIAQEVEKVVPEVVQTDKDGYKSLSYDKLTAVLIEAVKEQQKQIEELKVTINQMRDHEMKNPANTLKSN
jgi:hypothetical protein